VLSGVVGGKSGFAARSVGAHLDRAAGFLDEAAVELGLFGCRGVLGIGELPGMVLNFGIDSPDARRPQAFPFPSSLPAYERRGIGSNPYSREEGNGLLLRQRTKGTSYLKLPGPLMPFLDLSQLSPLAQIWKSRACCQAALVRSI